MKFVYPGPKIKTHAGTWSWTRGKVRNLPDLTPLEKKQLKAAGIVEATKKVLDSIGPSPKEVIKKAKEKIAQAEEEIFLGGGTVDRDKSSKSAPTVKITKVRTGD